MRDSEIGGIEYRNKNRAIPTNMEKKHVEKGKLKRKT